MSETAAAPVDGLQSRYDETPYRDQRFEDVDLARLLGLARLFELGPEESGASGLRVLDLACASGEHIREQAARYPSVHFTGVDFSRIEIEAGQKAIVESGATNVELLLSDLREFEIPEGEFDVILCRGAFSWVPDDVKERIFELCRVGLKRSGVAAIAYLTYPGWKQRESIRELLALRARKLEDPQERLRESAMLLRLLHAGYSAHGESPHAQSLKAVVEDMQASSANAFVHDELGDIHDPCYFIQFAEWAAEWGLQYVAETDFGSMVLGGLPEQASGILQALAPDFLETQQLIDFLVNRSGRTSLIARDDARLARELSTDVLGELSFATTLRYVRSPDSLRGAPLEFETSRAQRIELRDPCDLAVVQRMLDFEAPAAGLAELEDCAPGVVGSERDVAQCLLGLIARGYVDPQLRGL